MKYIHSKYMLALYLCLLAGAVSAVSNPSAAAPAHEPRNETEAMLQAKFGGGVSASAYEKWTAYVESKDAEEQAWLRILESQLGNFYFPHYLNELFSPHYDRSADAWAHVKDDPDLPRVLIIGDSISRAYTATVRNMLEGRANVHRAPANCGPTSKFLQVPNPEVWLNQNGSDRWDIVIINFGIHDGNNPAGYEERLRKVLACVKKTGASAIYWVRTTPWGKNAAVFEDVATGDASVLTNPISDRVVLEEGLVVIDAQSLMLPLISTDLNKKDFTHWSPSACEGLGKAIAGAIEPSVANFRKTGVK